MFDAEAYIKEYQQTETGAPRLRLLKKAIQAADDAKNDEWSFEFRYRYLHDSTFDADDLDGLIIFPEMLALYDNSEELQADDEYQHKLMWGFKWILANAQDFPNVPLEQIEGFFSEFKKRLEQYGKSLRPYYYERESFTAETHNLLPAEEYGKYREMKEDDLKDCKACEASHDVWMALAVGDVEKAKKASEPIFSGALRCAEVPQHTYGYWIEHDIKTGNYAHAQKLAKRLYPMVRHDMSLLQVIGILLHYYSVTDRYAGVSIFRHELKNYLNCRNQLNKLSFANGAYRLFRNIQTEEIGLFLPPEFPLWQENNRYQCAALRDYFYDEARTLAEKFDARNGNTYEMDQLNAEDPPYDGEAGDVVSGFTDQIPSVIAAVFPQLPDELTLQSVTKAVEADGRFRVTTTRADEQGVLGFQVEETAGDEEMFQFMLVCQPVPPVEEFRPASPIADDVIDAVKNSEGIITCVMPFEQIQPDIALHLQLKIMQLICPGAVAYLDFSRRKLLPAGWVTLAALSDVPPLVDYLYNLQLYGDPESDYLWIRTYGLRCCGLREIEILDATKENYPRYCDLLSFATESILLKGEMADAKAPFTVLRKADDNAVICTWVTAAEADADYPAENAAGMAMRREQLQDADVDDEVVNGNAILYLYDGEAADGTQKRKRLDTLTEDDFQQFRYGTYIVTSRKIAALAKERYPYFQSLFARYPETSYVCLYVEKDDEEEEVWMKVTEAGETEIKGELAEDCLLGSVGTPYTAALRQLTDFSVKLDENLIVHPNTAYIAIDIAD